MVASHFSVIVRGTAQLFVAGPPVVAAAMGETPDKEELGGARAQSRAGAVDNEAADEDDALAPAALIPLLSAPERVGAAADRGVARTRADRREEDLLSIVPRERRKPYKARRILEAVLDRGSLFEIGALVRAPADHRAGPARRAVPSASSAPTPTTTEAGSTRTPPRSSTRFVDLCDQFRLPVVNFVDQPGFVIGTEAERRGHDPPRHARAGRRLSGDGAVGLGARAQGVRRRGRGARPRRAA